MKKAQQKALLEMINPKGILDDAVSEYIDPTLEMMRSQQALSVAADASEDLIQEFEDMIRENILRKEVYLDESTTDLYVQALLQEIEKEGLSDLDIKRWLDYMKFSNLILTDSKLAIARTNALNAVNDYADSVVNAQNSDTTVQ